MHRANLFTKKNLFLVFLAIVFLFFLFSYPGSNARTKNLLRDKNRASSSNSNTPIDKLFKKIGNASVLTSVDPNPADFLYYQYPSTSKFNGAVYRSKDAHLDWVDNSESHLRSTFEAHYGEPGCVFLDVGANSGQYSILMAGSGCKVISFEFQYKCIEFFTSAIAVNGLENNIRLVRRPVSYEEKEIGFRINKNSCNGGLRIHESTSFFSQFWSVPLNLQTVVLDDFIPSDVHISLMKVDVEGFDANVMRGAMEMIKRKQIDEILVELTAEMWPIKYDPEGLKVYKDILKAGYTAKCFGITRFNNREPDNPLPAKTNVTYDKNSLDAFEKEMMSDDPCLDFIFYLPKN